MAAVWLAVAASDGAPTAESTTAFSELRLDQAAGVYRLDGHPFTGVTVRPLRSGRREAISMVHGKKHGLRRQWYASGKMSFTAEYHQGRLHGTSRSWWHDGARRSESHFIYGVQHGTQREWYANGAKIKELSLEHGQEQGMQRAWRRNGKLYANYEARNGRIFGLKRSQLCFQLEDQLVRQ